MSQLTTKEIRKHIVDLRRSEWDKESSNRKKGNYHFFKKVYVKDSDYLDKDIRPDYVFFFVGYAEQDPLSGFDYWRMHFQAELVTENDDYWPEPLRPDAEGKYKFLDSVLVKVPVLVWLEKVDDDKSKYDKTAKGIHKAFQDQASAAGCGIKELEF